MVNKKDNNEFMPAVAIPPGDTIRENMEYLGMDQEELAARLGITTKHLSNILNGNSPITYETALRLESVIGPSAEFWMELETQYQLDKSRIEKQDELALDLNIVTDIPYNKMSSFGWVSATKDRNEKVMNCREFFGVARLSLIQNSYQVMYRKQKLKHEISDLSVLAWLRRAEIVGHSIEVGEFNKNKLKNYIPKFRELTLCEPSEFYPKIQKMCAECGVALILVEDLPKTYIFGATIWRNNKAILALSVRGKRADIFWFTLFHELAHIINHSSKEFHINYENSDTEDEADKIASAYLISDDLYKKFITEYDYTNKGLIVRYSHEIGIAPCILVGRMLHDRLIDYRMYSDLRPSFEIRSSKAQ